MPCPRSPILRGAVLACSSLLFVVYYALGGLRGEIVWVATVFAQLAVATWAALGFRRHRVAWLLIIAGQASFLAGDVGFMVLEFGLESDAFPSFADAFYLVGYVLIPIGLFPIARTQRLRRDVGGMIDATIVTMAVGAIMWVFIIEPNTAESGTSMFARVIAAAYTFGDVLALGILALLLSRRAGNDRAFWLTATSIATLFAADTGYAVMSLHGEYDVGGPLDALWWISYTLLVLAVLHPGCEALGSTGATHSPRLSATRLAALAVAALAAPVVLIARIGTMSLSQVVVLLASTVVMFLLVIVRLQLIARDLDDSRVRLTHEANHDALTDLANRTLLTSEMRRALDELEPDGDGQVALLCLDLDDFKPINDLLGHPTGDELLRLIADRLRSTVRRDDVVARLGGDEFAVLLPNSDAVQAIDVAERVIEAVSRAADIGGPVEVYPSVSIGVVCGDAGSSPDDLLRDGDIAMYAAKRRGKGQWAVFEHGIAEHVMDWLELRAELGAALSDGQLYVEYQPIVHLDDLSLAGAEALLRWDHPVRGLIPPDRFIGVAEDSGLIVPIGAWVLQTACRDAQAWTDDPRGPDISVNVSPRQIVDASLVDHVRAALDASGLAPSRLIIEITESGEIVDDVAATDVMHELRRMGVRIALDDLGAGFASLRYLRAFPIEIVKFDRSFMTELDDHGLLAGLIGLARSLDLITVVEGIEDERHEQVSRSLGAGYAQGFRYARPLPAASIVPLMTGLVGSPSAAA